MNDKMFKAGEYRQEFNILAGQNLPCGPIYQSFGLRKHVEKHLRENPYILDYISIIIQKPDYIGHDPKKPNSIELVKKIQEHIMVCIKLDQINGYLYVATAFPITESKLNNRLNSGRVKKC